MCVCVWPPGVVSCCVLSCLMCHNRRQQAVAGRVHPHPLGPGGAATCGTADRTPGEHFVAGLVNSVEPCLHATSQNGVAINFLTRLELFLWKVATHSMHLFVHCCVLGGFQQCSVLQDTICRGCWVCWVGGRTAFGCTLATACLQCPAWCCRHTACLAAAAACACAVLVTGCCLCRISSSRGAAGGSVVHATAEQQEEGGRRGSCQPSRCSARCPAGYSRCVCWLCWACLCPARHGRMQMNDCTHNHCTH